MYSYTMTCDIITSILLSGLYLLIITANTIKSSLIGQLEIQLKEHISERKSVLDKSYLTTRESYVS